jgi:uncharacterized membrane protein
LIARLVARMILASLFLFAGVVHLTRPALFLPVMPPWIPFHFFSIIASGFCELLGGLGLLVPEHHVLTLTGWCLVALLIAVFPANIYMATNHVQLPGLSIPTWLEWARLPFQPLLILAVLWATRIWPKVSEL